MLAWIGLAASGFLTHYFFAFVWLAMTAWLLLYGGRSARGRPSAWRSMVGVLILPWYAQVPASLAAWRVTGAGSTRRSVPRARVRRDPRSAAVS